MTQKMGAGSYRARRLAPFIALAALVLVGLSSCEKAPPPPFVQAGTTSVRIGIAIPSYVHGVAWIAADDGYLEKAGVKPDVQVMGGSAATLRTLIAKQIDVGLAGGDAVLKARNAGSDVVIVASFVNRYYHRLVARQGIDTGEALKGKKIGLPFLGGPQDMAVKAALTDLGLTYGNDVEILNMGKEMNRMAALERGEIDATTSQSPPGILKEQKLNVLVDLPATDRAFPYMVFIVTRETLNTRRADVKKALGGLCSATKAYKDASNKTKHIEMIAEHTRDSDVKGHAEERYQTTGPSLLSFPPVVDRAAIESVAKELKLGPQAVSEAVDDSLLNELTVDGGPCASPSSAP